MSSMNCLEARPHLLDLRRGRVEEPLRAALEAHLAGCEACRREDVADQALSALLEERLIRHTAPASLRRAVENRVAEAASHEPRPRSVPRWSGRALRLGVSGAIAAASLAAGVAIGTTYRARSEPEPMATEAVNDYLRVVYSEHPLDVPSGGIHQVKPWFEGRVDFAPVVPFAGDDDFPLQGGAVAYFLDRKAATFVFKRRLHVITLFVFRSDGLSWPTAGLQTVGHAHVRLETSRGFHVLLWRDEGLGYALVSDVDARDLLALGAKIAP